MTPDPSVTIGDLDPDALAIVRDLYYRGDLHWEHRPPSEDPEARAPAWVQEAVVQVHHVHTSTFSTEAKLPATWMQGHATALPLADGSTMTWERAREIVLHALDSMLMDSGYRKGSKFYPEEIPGWFVTKPPRKPSWSCFLRFANVPLVRKQEALDLASKALEGYADKGTATVQRIRNAMTPDAVEAVEKALRKPGVTVFQVTAWERAGRLYGWWKGAQGLRDQFGEQLDRPEAMRHGYRWDKEIGVFWGLVALTVEWSMGKGGWKGWFPIPADAGDWSDFVDFVAREYAVWMMEVPVPMEPCTWISARPGKWEAVFSLDTLGALTSTGA